MSPFVKDGVYKVRNLQFRDYVVDLTNGVPMGPIGARRDSIDNANDKWIIKNQGFGGIRITLENVSAPGNPVSPEQFPGAPSVGSREPNVWTVVKADPNHPVYYLQSSDAMHAWELPIAVDDVNLALIRHTMKDNTKWTFDRLDA